MSRSNTKRLNVLQFITPAGYYGAERWVVALARNIDSDKVRCDLVLPTGHDADCEELIENFPTDNGEVFRIKTLARFDWSTVGKLAELIKEREIDLLHTHGYKSDILGVFAARKAGICCISTPHGFGHEPGIKLKLYGKASALALRYHAKVVPLSPELLREMARRGIPEDKLHYIPNGVDASEIEAYREPANEQANSMLPEKSSQSFNMGYIGRLDTGKGMVQLVKIFDRVWKKNPQARLFLVGDGPLREKLEALVDQLDGKANVTFTGFQKDRFSFLKKFDVFVMASISEGIPRSVMEAMMFEVPVVAYDIPGVDELIEHGKTGLLAPLGDLSIFAENLQQLISDPELRQRVAVAGKTHVAKQHSAISMANSYAELYANVYEQSETQ